MYDYVIVGAGSAGCVLAARLTEDPDVSVLLLEAGPPDSNENIHVPLGYLSLGRTEVDWDFDSAPEPFCDHRRIKLPRGRVLGGSSSINAMVYIRGNRADYDGWGIDGWGYDDLLPYFLRAEDNERGASAFHGVGGPLPVVRQPLAQPDVGRVRRRRRQAGHPANDDFNGAAPGRLRPLPADAAQRHARQRRRRLPAPGDRAPEPDRDAVHARPPRPVRGDAGRRRRGRPARPAAGVPRGARGDPLRRRLQLAAAADALRASAPPSTWRCARSRCCSTSRRSARTSPTTRPRRASGRRPSR